MRNKEKERYLRDVQDVIYIIGGRWKGAILASLCDKPKRFNELKRDVGNITPRSLIKELKFLEMSRLVLKIENEKENITIYSLTEHGYSLLPVINTIVEWAGKHRKMIIE